MLQGKCLPHTQAGVKKTLLAKTQNRDKGDLDFVFSCAVDLADDCGEVITPLRVFLSAEQGQSSPHQMGVDQVNSCL